MDKNVIIEIKLIKITRDCYIFSLPDGVNFTPNVKDFYVSFYDGDDIK